MKGIDEKKLEQEVSQMMIMFKVLLLDEYVDVMPRLVNVYIVI